nr:VCBS repeat-containing protein [Luteimonas sp.]
MRKELLGLLLIGGLAGCTSQWDTDRAEASRSSDATKAESAQTPAALLAQRGAQRSLASLPDRGELLQYAKDRKARKSGAYTYHPVAISEAHALNAIAKGGMRVNLPDGRALDLEYDRYEEQPDGNWTWIGRNEDGSEAVLTFGDKAVFGMIASGGQSFGVRTDASGAWIVETNALLLAAGGGHGRRKEGPDYLAPAALAGSSPMATASASSLKQAAAGEKAAVNEKAVAVVDVLLGFSSGVAADVGGESGARTLMASRVALTNAAYQASGVTMRLRLVHSMLVNYSDTGAKNDATLRKLTGYDETTQQDVPVDAAFTALRAAREEYGADLVALVRRYREPQQDGCGIAWLIGMNQRQITSQDARFGYAVVGDGTDIDESDNNTYKCSLYALAHELGHLMGQAHNTEDAAGRAGAHTYSYGYREAASSGFFTIMAYPRDDTQAVNEIGNFANPAVNYSGRPTGTATADNVRSMNQTMPTIGQFRATVVPLGNVRSDFDGDGKSDIIFRNSSNGQNVIWKSANHATQQQMAAVASQAWIIAGTGDFNGDGKVDVLWRNTSTGANSIWRGGLNTQYQAVAAVTNQAWKVAGVGDFNGDGMADILWRRSDTGQNSIWRGGNLAAPTAVASVVGGGWTVAGIGDFNGDGRSDILWRSTTT